MKNDLEIISLQIIEKVAEKMTVQRNAQQHLLTDATWFDVCFQCSEIQVFLSVTVS